MMAVIVLLCIVELCSVAQKNLAFVYCDTVDFGTLRSFKRTILSLLIFKQFLKCFNRKSHLSACLSLAVPACLS